MNYAAEIASLPTVKNLLNSALSGRVSHAYLLVCDDLFTLDTVGSLLVCACEHLKFERVHAGGYADVIFLPEDREKQKILTADVEKITSECVLTPTELNKKYYVVRYAETMNESAGNKLLKTLEEAPPSAVIILLCSDENALLPTVKSRCTRVDIPPLSEEKILAAFPDSENSELSLALSGGYLGAYSNISQSDRHAQAFSLALETLLYMKTSRNILTYSQKIAKKPDDIPIILQCLAVILEDCMYLSAALHDKIRLKSKRSDVAELVQNGYSYKAVASIMPHVDLAKKKLQSYCSAQGVVDGLLFSILEEKSKCQKS